MTYTYITLPRQRFPSSLCCAREYRQYLRAETQSTKGKIQI